MNLASTGELTLAPEGPATPWSPGIPFRDTNGGLDMYCFFYNFCSFTVQHGTTRCELLTLSPGLPPSPAAPAGPGRP